MADDIQRQILEELKKLNERAEKSEGKAAQSQRSARVNSRGGLSSSAISTVSPLGGQVAGGFQAGGAVGAAAAAGKSIIDTIQNVISAGSRARSDTVKNSSGLETDEVVDARSDVKSRFSQNDALADAAGLINKQLGDSVRERFARQQREFNKLADPAARTREATRSTVTNAASEFSRATGQSLGEGELKDLIKTVTDREKAVTETVKNINKILGQQEAKDLAEFQSRVSRF